MEVTEEQKKAAVAQAEALAEQKKQEAELKKLIETPITKEEYDKRSSEASIDLAKMLIIRQKAMTQLQQLQLRISAIDEQIGLIKMDMAVLERRTLNTTDAK